MLPVIDFKSAANGIMIHSKILSWIVARRNLYCHPLKSWFITDALSYEDLDFTIRAVDKVSKPLDTEKL
jgi:glutamate-1-semialdehyde 2,1-aminomutase